MQDSKRNKLLTGRNFGMKTLAFEIPEQGIVVFSTMLFWWGTIRKHYKENNHISMCLDMAYDALMEIESDHHENCENVKVHEYIESRIFK
jgi:hypothetical protein